MRLVVTLWAVLVFTQPLLAGQFGGSGFLAVHVPLGVRLFGWRRATGYTARTPV